MGDDVAKKVELISKMRDKTIMDEREDSLLLEVDGEGKPDASCARPSSSEARRCGPSEALKTISKICHPSGLRVRGIARVSMSDAGSQMLIGAVEVSTM